MQKTLKLYFIKIVISLNTLVLSIFADDNIINALNHLQGGVQKQLKRFSVIYYKNDTCLSITQLTWKKRFF